MDSHIKRTESFFGEAQKNKIHGTPKISSTNPQNRIHLIHHQMAFSSSLSKLMYFVISSLGSAHVFVLQRSDRQAHPENT